MITATEAAKIAIAVPKETIESKKLYIMESILKQAGIGSRGMLISLNSEWDNEIVVWLIGLGYSVEYADYTPKPERDSYIYSIRW